MRLPIPRQIRPFTKSQLVLVFAFCLLLPALAPGQRRHSASPTPSPTPEPQPTPPMLEFQAIPTRDNLERGQTVTINLVLTSKSNVAVSNPRLIITSDAFDVVTLPHLGNSLGPFAAVRGAVVLKARPDAAFTKHAIAAGVQYTWGQAPHEFKSEQSATVTLEVKRPFQDEAGGLPGGTAALFLLLLPVIPAFLGYQLVESKRQFGKVKISAFSPEYVLVTFLIAILVNAIAFLITGRHWWLDFSNPVTLIVVILGSLFAGAIIPGVRWYLDKGKAKEASQWEFNQNESVETYLRKALLSPYNRREFEWVMIPVGKEEWEGISLQQPNGEPVLGAQLTVGFEEEVSENAWREFLDQVLSKEGAVKDPERLLTMIVKGELSWEFLRKVARDKTAIPDFVIVEEIRKTKKKRTSPKACPLLIPIR